MTNEKKAFSKKTVNVITHDEYNNYKNNAPVKVGVVKGKKSVQYKNDTASSLSKRRSPHANVGQPRKNVVTPGYCLLSSAANIYARLFLIEDTLGNQKKVVFKPLPLK